MFTRLSFKAVARAAALNFASSAWAASDLRVIGELFLGKKQQRGNSAISQRQ